MSQAISNLQSLISFTEIVGIVQDLRSIGVWLAHEGAQLLRRLREPGLWVALLIGLLLWSLAYQTTPTAVIHVGGDRTTQKRHYDAPFLVAGSFNASNQALIPGGRSSPTAGPPITPQCCCAGARRPALGDQRAGRQRSPRRQRGREPVAARRRHPDQHHASTRPHASTASLAALQLAICA